MKNKHLSIDDRIHIQIALKENKSFKLIGKELGKDCTTIAKEVKNHFMVEQKGTYGKSFNDCKFRHNCPEKKNHIKCNKNECQFYELFKCPKLSKPPYTCNGCSERNKCTLEKHIYNANYAHKEYQENLKESRTGITFNQDELNNLNNFLKPLIVQQGQSIHNAVINNKNKIMCSEREIYKLIDSGILDIRNIDLPRKVRFRIRRKSKTTYKIDKKCLENRRYDDFKTFMENNTDTNVVEMDTVIGKVGGKVLLTILFRNCNLMLAFIRENNDAQSVIDIFNSLEDTIGLDEFKKLFPVILTDNGSEFSNPSEIEYNKDGIKRTRIFYCEPGRPDQKATCEVTHEFIRRVLPSGTSFDKLNQNDIDLLMSHINSYKRKKLNDQSPLDLFNFIYNKDISKKLNIQQINANDINFKKNLFSKK